MLYLYLYYSEAVNENSTTVGGGDGESDEESESEQESNDLMTLLNYVVDYRTNLGVRLSDPFLRLPSRRLIIIFN